MAIIIRCRRCGFVLHKGDSPVSPEDIVKRYDYKCPRCLAPLSTIPLNIVIRKRRNKRFRR